MLVTFVLLTSIACLPCVEPVSCIGDGCLGQACLVDDCRELFCSLDLACYKSNSTCVDPTFRPAGNPECSVLNMCLGDPCVDDSGCSPELYCDIPTKCTT